MTSSSSYAYYTPRAYATILGTRFALSTIRIDYALNAIPQCQLVLPVGRSMTDNSVAAIHTLAAQLGQQTPIQIYASFSPFTLSDDSIADFGITEGDIKIFDGFTAAGGFSRATQGARFVLYANGALVKLNQASALSDSSHPGNPSRYSWPAILGNKGDAGGAAIGQDWTVVTQAFKSITPENLAADVWGKAIYPWFQQLTEQDGIWVDQPNLRGDGSNKQAATALKLLAPAGADYQPLAIQSTVVLDIDAASAIAQDIAQATADVTFTANQTLWDILVGHFATDYGFAIVPRINSSLVVPYVGGYAGKEGEPFTTITGGQYEVSDHPILMPRPIRGYGILASLLSRTGAAGFDDDGNPYTVTGFGGWYDATTSQGIGTFADGAVIIQQAPRWMNAAANPSQYSPASTGSRGTVIGTAADPGAAKTNNSRPKAAKRQQQVVKPLLDAFAQVRYAQEILKGRSLVISGPFRLDIAPGSLVLVEGASEQFIDGDQLAVGLFGDVQQLTLLMDCEQAVCGTSFHIGNVRTETENQTSQASIPRHPLYTKTFLGCELNDAPPPT